MPARPGHSRHRRKLLREFFVAYAIAKSEAIWSRREAGLTDRREVGETTASSSQPGSDPPSQPTWTMRQGRHCMPAKLPAQQHVPIVTTRLIFIYPDNIFICF